MCGIIGSANTPLGREICSKGLKIMQNRGKDASKIIKYKEVVFGHNLHSIIDFVKQPLVTKESLCIANCEIYNWKELSEKNKLNVKNDAELIQKLIDKKGISNIAEIVEELDGVFAFSYYSKKEEKIILARDLFGVKPLVYFIDKEKIIFASEKKALKFDSKNLNPREILIYNIKTKSLIIKKRIIKKTKLKGPKEEIQKLLLSAVTKRVPEQKVALLLSGGVDSTLIGLILKNNKIKFTSYFAGIKDFAEPVDLEFAKKASYDLNSVLKINLVSLKEYEKELPKIISLIESTDPVRVGVASTIYFATKSIKEKVCFSGLGADELFAGYARFKESTDVNKDCYSYLIKMYENDLYFEDIICMNNKTELRLPYLDKELVQASLALEPKYKISSDKKQNKLLLREFAESLGLNKEIAYRPKKAAQYGSNFDKALEKLARKNKFRSKADYLNSLQKKEDRKNISIAALISTGKDSLFAMSLMQKQGYDIKCLITIDSKNKDSYMFHTPTIALAKLQAQSLGKHLVLVKTIGKKEKELSDLKKAIKEAKKKYNIEGICSGALFSNYQRERIEKICESLGIRAFAPLWQMNQAQYMKQLIKEKFSIMITKIACYGLGEEWLGKILKIADVEKLIALEKKFKINVAGEGGEYETLVLDMPLFEKRLSVKFEKKMENEFTGTLIIKNAKLENKI